VPILADIRRADTWELAGVRRSAGRLPACLLNCGRLRLEIGVMRRISWAICLTGLLAVVAGCQQKPERTASSGAAEASAKPTVGKVERAVASAVGVGAPAAAASSGPPADGVLESVRAEAEAPSGTAPKLTVGSAGAEPRVALRSAKAQLPRSIKVEVSLQAGMDQVPPVEVTLGLDSKPMAAAAKKIGDETAEAKTLAVTAKVRDVKVTLAEVPAEFVSQIAGLKGARIAFSLASNGGGYGFTAELAPGAKPELRDLLDTIVEALSLAALPVPSEPLGSGAFWMVVSRDKSAGFGLVSYHMAQLSRADAKSADVELDSRRYAAGRVVDPAIMPQGSGNITLQEMSAGLKARIQFAPDVMLPISIEASATLRGTLDGGEGQPKRGVQSATSYRILSAR
jgi:hypothetical protein